MSKWINRFTLVLDQLLSGLCWLLFRLFPIEKGKIVFSNYYGRGYGDNPKYIAEALQCSASALRLIWLVQDDQEAKSLPDGIEPCSFKSLKRIYHLSTASVWVDNCRKSFLFKRKGQLYLQTWHGFALKRIEKDVEDKLNWQYVKIAKRDSRHIDYIMSCSQFMTDIYMNSFWYNGEILPYGSPRNDMLISGDLEISTRVREFFDLPQDTKMILYAPTFRADGSLAPYEVDFNRVLLACEKRFGKGFAVLVRLHPNIASRSNELGIVYTQNIINATYYPDMQELLCASDMVISDYSSLMFDFALSMKPCFQFAMDIVNYKQDRNFYFSLDKLPFPLAVDNDSLEENIRSFDYAYYKDRLTEFYTSVGMIMGGNASARCAELIIRHCRKEDR